MHIWSAGLTKFSLRETLFPKPEPSATSSFAIFIFLTLKTDDGGLLGKYPEVAKCECFRKSIILFFQNPS